MHQQLIPFSLIGLLSVISSADDASQDNSTPELDALLTTPWYGVDSAFRKGIELQQKGHGAEAVAMYKLSARIVPSHADSYFNLALSTQMEGVGGTKPEAYEFYHKALFCNSFDSSTYFNAAILLEDDNKYLTHLLGSCVTS